MAISDKLTYLNETKTLLKNKINLTGANITTDTFRQYPIKLQNALLECWNNEGEPIFTNWGTKVNGEGTNVKLDNTINARMKLTPKGNTSQTGTPTPSNPVDVNVVSGDNEVDIVGKNLWDNSQVSNVSDYIVKNDTGFKLIRTTNGRISPQYSINLKADTTYTISCNLTKTTTGNYIYCQWITSDGNTIWTPNIGNGTTQITPTKDIIGVIFYLQNTEGYDVYVEITNFQIEKGSTATTYEPYTSQNYPLYLGVENLLNPLYNLYGYGLNASGVIYENSVWSTNNSFIKVQPNTTYSFSTDIDDIQRHICFYDSTQTFIERQQIQFINTFTTGATTYYVKCAYRNDRNPTQIQLEVGSKVNEFTPYGTPPIELNKIGTYQDYIYKNGSKWYLHKEVGKYQFKASDNWYGPIYYNSNQNIRWNKNPQVLGIDIKYDEFIYCNLLTYATPSQATSTGNDNLIVSNSGWTVSITYGGTTDRATMNSTFENKGMYFYYVLQTPTETEITNTTLINQLESLKGAMSYEGQTNIDGGFMIVGASALGELE